MSLHQKPPQQGLGPVIFKLVGGEGGQSREVQLRPLGKLNCKERLVSTMEPEVRPERVQRWVAFILLLWLDAPSPPSSHSILQMGKLRPTKGKSLSQVTKGIQGSRPEPGLQAQGSLPKVSLAKPGDGVQGHFIES